MTLRPAPARAPFMVAGVGLFAALGLLLTGCAPTVSMDPAPSANTLGCADITVRLPDTVAGLAKRETDAQATGAWGDPAAVLLRCGVPPIGPTTQPCIEADGVDWVLEGDPAGKTIRYITYGRTPATEVVIDHTKTSDAPVLADLAPAIASIPQGSKCLSIADTTSTPVPTP